jgi:hypothetical protein
LFFPKNGGPMKMREFMIIVVVALVGFGRSPAGEQKENWSVIKTGHYDILYKPGNEKDANKVRGILNGAIAALKEEFTGLPVEQLLHVDCKVYLHPKSNEKASESTAGITTIGGDQYSAVIDLLTLSAYDKAYRSNVGERADDDYYRKLVVHEYSTILLDRITRSKKTGWRFFSAPRWFVDGYEEYLGLTLSSPHNRKAVLGKYLTVLKQNPDRVDFDLGMNVEDPYIDGAMVLLFMHEMFGRERVHGLLLSTEPRFGKAVLATLGISFEQFHERWGKWLKTKLADR